MAKSSREKFIRNHSAHIASLAAVVLVHLGGAGTGFAAEVKVTDCDGTPRAIREVTDGSKTLVELRVTGASGNSASDVGFHLLENTSPQGTDNPRFKTLVVDGRGSFKEVPAGNWKICRSNDSIQATVSQVAIITSDEEGSTSAATWLGGAGVALTGMGIGVFSGQGSSGDTVPSSTGGAEPPGSDEPSTAPLLPADESTSPSTPSGETPSGKPGKIACPAEEDCLNDERPNPVAPISPST